VAGVLELFPEVGAPACLGDGESFFFFFFWLEMRKGWGNGGGIYM
jgi:hypothetical protein